MSINCKTVIKNQLVNRLALIGFAVLSQLIFITPVQALTQDFQWTGLRGFSARGTLSYDENIATKIIAEKGSGETRQLESLKINFYSPDNELMAQYHDVVDGVSLKDYFELKFDTIQHQFIGEIDLGGETPGELFLTGRVGEQLSLVKIEPSGEEHTIDSDR